MLRAFWVLGLLGMILANASPLLAQRYTVQKSVKGIVVDEQGKPVANADVHFPFIRQPTRDTKADAEGRFTFEYRDFVGDTASIVAKSPDGMKQGLLTLSPNCKEPGTEEVTVELKPTESVRVKVVDGNSKPIAKAKAGALLGYPGHGAHKVWGETNSEGDVVWQIPSGAESVSFFALKSGQGLDYVNYGDPKDPVEIPNKVTLQLDRATTVEIDVVDGDEQPLADVRVYVWLVPKPSGSSQSRDLFDLSSFADEICERSDRNGKVRFDWLPAWGKHLTTFGDKSEYANGRLDTLLSDEAPANKLLMHKSAKVAGRVLMPDGTPAKEIEVTLTGRNYDSDGIHMKALTDIGGKFSFDAKPHHFCMIGAKDGKLVARPIDGIVTHPDKPIEELELRLAPGIRVHGKVTKESNRLPEQGISITLQHLGRGLKDFPGILLPEPTDKGLPFIKHVSSQISEDVKTNAEGVYEFYASPGSIFLSLRLKAPITQADELFEKHELTTEKEYQRDFLIPFNAEPR